MVERIGNTPVLSPVQPIEEPKKHADYSWHNSTLSATDTANVYGANPDAVNDFIFDKSAINEEAPLNGEKQAEARGQKSIPPVTSHKEIGIHENQLEKEQLKALEEYIKNRLEQIVNTSTHLKGKRVQEKYIREQILDLKKELIEQEKKSNVLKWLDRIFTGGMVIAGIGSIILTIGTSGAAVPLIAVFANAVLAIGSGTTKIISAVNQHKADKRIGSLIELDEVRKIINSITSEDIDELRDVNDKEMQAHKQKQKEQQKKDETIKQMIDRK